MTFPTGTPKEVIKKCAFVSAQNVSRNQHDNNRQSI